MGLKDIRQKGTEIELNGEKRILLFDLNAFAELEERYGSVDKAMEELSKGSVKGIRTLLWAGLLHENENLTEKEVGSMFTIGDLQDLSAQIGEALQKGLPEQPAKAEGNSAPKKPRAR